MYPVTTIPIAGVLTVASEDLGTDVLKNKKGEIDDLTWVCNYGLMVVSYNQGHVT